MKLGTQTGSLVNHLYARGVIGQPEPVVGMGATILSWTDRHAATIVNVATIGTKLHVEVQPDRATRTDTNGMSESQTYVYERDPGARSLMYRREKNGMWVNVTYNPETKRWAKTGGEGLRIGDRHEYRDFCF